MQCKKQPIVQLELFRPCVNSTVEHEHLNTIFLVRLGNQLALVVTNKVDIIRDGLSPVFIRF